MQKVLKGEYEPPPNIDKYAQKLLSFQTMHELIKNALPVSTVVMVKEYELGWRRAKNSPRQAHLDTTLVM